MYKIWAKFKKQTKKPRFWTWGFLGFLKNLKNLGFFSEPFPSPAFWPCGVTVDVRSLSTKYMSYLWFHSWHNYDVTHNHATIDTSWPSYTYVYICQGRFTDLFIELGWARVDNTVKISVKTEHIKHINSSLIRVMQLM